MRQNELTKLILDPENMPPLRALGLTGIDTSGNPESKRPQGGYQQSNVNKIVTMLQSKP